MPKKPSVAEKEDAKVNAAAEAAGRRSRNKKDKGKWQMQAVIGSFVGVCLLAIFLAASNPGPKKPGGNPKWDAYVNDRGTVDEVTGKAEGNFTAAASPFFNKWTLADAKWGLDGVSVSNMIGISGAIQVCGDDEGLEGGVIPPSYDSRENWPGCFGEVQDSGNCSSSYAIAAAETLGARFCIGDNAKYGSLRLSAQQILSCDKKSKGCKGGMVDSVWAYIQRRGLYPEECVPYAGEKGAQCKTECKEEQKLKVLDHCVMTREKAIKREIYNRGPVVAPLYLKSEYLVYGSGVYTPTENSDQLFDEKGEAILHAVSVVGWGKSQGNPYWIVRHSWGSTWGENGYARVSIGSVVRDSYVVVGTAGTEEAVQAAELKKAEEDKKREEAKVERAARDERIRENRKKMEAEKAAASEESELSDLDDDDFEAELDLDDPKPEAEAE